MKFLLIVASIFALTLADGAPEGGYSGGSFNFGNGGYNTGFAGNGGSNSGSSSGSFGSGGFSNGNSNGFGAAPDANSNQAQAQGSQVYKYVSVHAAPEDPEDRATKTVRVPGGSNKHVNIIFVKAPSNGADQKTEIVLPEQDEHKNLVYVLVKKTDVAANLQIRTPQPTKPSKPEVYFIRYKNAAQQQGQAGDAGNVGGAISVGDFGGSSPTSGSLGSLSPAYGAPTSGSSAAFSPAYGAPTV